MISATLKTVGIGLALVGGGYVAYKAVMKMSGLSGDSTPLADAVQDAAAAPTTFYGGGKTGYRNPDGTFTKMRSMHDPNRDK